MAGSSFEPQPSMSGYNLFLKDAQALLVPIFDMPLHGIKMNCGQTLIKRFKTGRAKLKFQATA